MANGIEEASKTRARRSRFTQDLIPSPAAARKPAAQAPKSVCKKWDLAGKPDGIFLVAEKLIRWIVEDETVPVSLRCPETRLKC